MHGREGGEDWKRRRRHMWSVPAPGPQSPPVVVRSSSSAAASSDSLVQSSADSFLKDGRKIRVGDCALFQAGNAPPFIGIIRWFTVAKEASLKLCVNWLYRPADVKLAKGILEAAPNEVFYSFHEDVVLAASLLHPCKVAFLRKGVELPPGISSFVCRRVYDIENKRLWWLTDQDYLNERQEEVNLLLDRTRLEMHAAVQSGGRSPKPLNGPTATQQLKPGTDSVQNSGNSFPSQAKGRKRERVADQGTEPIKRERPAKTEDGESAGSRLDNVIKADITKITEKGSLTTTEGVEKLVHLMQLDRNERKIDLAGRILLADVIAATDRIDCLGRFVQLKGVPVLDDWLQEAHKGKLGDGSSPKESDKGAENLLLSLLRALDKLPVNLNALQTCNVGKSVNHLRSHKNTEIQKKARSLVDTWKKRVDAEMTKINDAKSSGANQAVTWPVKQGFSDISHSGSRRSGSAEATAKAPSSQTSTCKNKPGQSDFIVKSSPVTQGPSKLQSPLVAAASISSKDSPMKGAGSSGNSELPLATVKEEKSSSSSQSQNNSQSCSSDHAKTVGSSWKEDARSSTAGSVDAAKTSGSSSRHRRSKNQKEASLSKTGPLSRHFSLDKASNQSGLSCERTSDLPMDHANGHRLIVRLPNPGRSPARSASGGSIEDPSVPGSRVSSPGAHDKHDHNDRKTKLKGDACRSHISADINAESWQSNDVKEGQAGSDEGDRSPLNEQRGADETCRVADASRAACSSSGNRKGVPLVEPKLRNSFSSMNALVESCAKCSEASVPISAGDDIGINLLANVAAGEISKSDLITSSVSPRCSPKAEPCGANNEAKSGLLCEDAGAHNCGPSDDNADCGSVKQGKSVGRLGACEKSQETCLQKADENKSISQKPKNELANNKEGLKGDDSNESIMDDNKPSDCPAEIVEGASDSAVNSVGDGSDTNKVPSNVGSSGAALTDQPQPVGTQNHANDSEKTGKNVLPLSSADKVPSSEIADVDRIKRSDEDGSREEHNGFASSTAGLAEDGRENASVVPFKESDKCAKPVPSKLSGVDPDRREEVASSAEASSALVTSEPDNGAKLDFDLNEGLSGDDGIQNEQTTSAAPVSLPAIRLPTLSPFLAGSMSNGPPASITVAAPAKGPFVPPENLLKNRTEPGWKGSAATSAFRPAEPRKVLEMPLNTSEVQSCDTGKQARPPLDIDLNEPDERILEDMASQSSPQTTGSESGVISNREVSARSSGGLDLDLNKTDEGVDNIQLLASTSSRLAVSHISVKPASAGFAETNMLRDFDLNNGPGIDDAGTEAFPKNQQAKATNVPFLPPISGLRFGNAELGNVSSWFAPGNSYPAVAIPSFLPDRVEQAYPVVATQGGQRLIGSVAGAGSFSGDVYRGPVLSSSPAMAFPTATPFPYAGFPFPSSFPLTSTSFPGSSTTYADSSSVPPNSFPAVPSQPLGAAGAFSSHYMRPYVVSVPEGNASAGSESSSRKWSRQGGLDLNAGPGSADVDTRDDRLSSAIRQMPAANLQPLTEEQARMYQLAGGGGMKRKEREGGSWDERSYKQPSWQ